MIKALEVTNFQGHKYSLLEFDKGVNNIKGTSHNGKSSLIRAIIWALQNKPSGFNFKSWFSTEKDETRVSIEFDNDAFISRARDKSFNGYDLFSDAESPLEALRTDVPEEIKAISNMGDINIQSQGEKFFMLQETPGNVAKELNKIVGLEIIHDVNKKVSSIINASLSESSRLKSEIEEKKEELKKYNNLAKIEKQINEVALLSSGLKLIMEHHATLEGDIRKIKIKQKELAETKDWLEIELPFNQIKKRQSRLTKLREKEEALTSLVNQCNNTVSEIGFTKDIISLEDDVNKAKELFGKVSELKNKHDELKKTYNDVQEVEKSLNFVSDTLKMKIKARTQLLKSNKNDFCSKCGAYRQHWRKK